jgi:hypothetical protein
MGFSNWFKTTALFLHVHEDESEDQEFDASRREMLQESFNLKVASRTV